MSSPTFTIREQWKEQMLYIEGEQQYAFDCGWGASPPELYLPSPAAWDAQVPAWLRGRRDEVVARLRASCRDYRIVEMP